ncbi:MAG: hypothetical protein U0U66_07465 [Cytophagaceae bacterium]
MENFDNIEEYLRGNLNDLQKEGFESTLNSDPLLKQEFEFQKDIINSIRDQRHAQLKATLNNTPVPTGASLWDNIYVRLAASLATVAATVGFFMLVMPSDSEKEYIDTSSSVIVKEAPEPVTIASSTSTTSTVEVNNIVETPKKVTESTPKTTTSTTKKTTPSNTTSQDPSSIEDVSDLDMINKEPIQVNTSKNNNPTTPIQTVQVKIIKDNNALGYRYFNNELYLHGDFSKDKYQLLNSASQTERFLYFDNQYYLLKQGTTKVTPLKAITDKQLISRLEILRAQ